MDAVFPILIVIIVAVVAVFAIIYSHKQAEKRRQELAALAGQLGWRFDPDKDADHDDEYAHFEVFRRGHSRAAYNTLTGQMLIDDRQFPAKVGDFTYKITRSNGKTTSTHTYHFSYMILHLPFPNVPDLLVRREGFFDKIAGAFGFDDIDFESEEFSRKFCVKSADKRFAYDVLHPRMMEFLLAGSPAAVDIEQGRCCLSDGTKRWSVDEFRARMGWIERFFDLWPDHLTAQMER